MTGDTQQRVMIYFATTNPCDSTNAANLRETLCIAAANYCNTPYFDTSNPSDTHDIDNLLTHLT